MNSNRKTYYYKKQLKGKGRFGGTELELVKIKKNSEIIDKCQWSDFKNPNSSFKPTPMLKSYKIYILKLLDFIILNHNSLQSVKLILHDIKILIVDTTPSHLMAAAIIGSFDLLGKPLNNDEIKIIDTFIINNENVDYPNFEILVIKLFNNNTLPQHHQL